MTFLWGPEGSCMFSAFSTAFQFSARPVCYSISMIYVYSRRMKPQWVIQKATSFAAWLKQPTCSCLVVSLSSSLWLLLCLSLPSIISESIEGVYIVPCAYLGLSKYQFITNLILKKGPFIGMLECYNLPSVPWCQRSHMAGSENKKNSTICSWSY